VSITSGDLESLLIVGWLVADIYNSDTTKFGKRMQKTNAKLKLLLDTGSRKKILITDYLQKKDLVRWTFGTGLHISLLCPFAKAVWNQVLTWEHFDTQLAQSVPDPLHMDDWWDKAAQKVPKSNKRHFNRLVIYTIWNILKKKGTSEFLTTLQSLQCRCLKG
jgi:hypothetical protein